MATEQAAPSLIKLLLLTHLEQELLELQAELGLTPTLQSGAHNC